MQAQGSDDPIQMSTYNSCSRNLECLPTISTKVNKFESESVNIGCLGKGSTQKVAAVNGHMNTRKFQMYQAMSHNRHSVSHVISKNILKEIKDKGTQRVLIQPQDIL